MRAFVKWKAQAIAQCQGLHQEKHGTSNPKVSHCEMGEGQRTVAKGSVSLEPASPLSDPFTDHQCPAGFNALWDETVNAFSRQCDFQVIINDRHFISIVLAFIIHRLHCDWFWRKLIPWIFVLCNVKLIADAWLGEIFSCCFHSY